MCSSDLWVPPAAIGAIVILLPAVALDTSGTVRSDCYSARWALLMWPALVGLITGCVAGARFARRRASAGAYLALLAALAIVGGVAYLVGATGGVCWRLEDSMDDAAITGFITLVVTAFGLAPGYLVGRFLRR